VSALPDISGDLTSAPAAEPAALACSLFAEHRQRVYRHCLWSLRSPHDAEDAVQQTYVNAFRALQAGVRPRLEAPWLLQIARNVCLERRRSAARRARLETLAGPETLEAVPAADDGGRDSSDLRAALEALEPRQREALLLREWRGLSYTEIATVLELSQSAVESLLFRARRSLARALDEGKRLRASLNLGVLLTWRRAVMRTTAGKTAVVAACCGVAVVAAPVLPHGRARHDVRVPTGAPAHMPQVVQPTALEPGSSPARRRAVRPETPQAAVASRGSRPATPSGMSAAPGADGTQAGAPPLPGTDPTQSANRPTPRAAPVPATPMPLTAKPVAVEITTPAGAVTAGVDASVGAGGASARVGVSAPAGTNASASASATAEEQTAAGASTAAGGVAAASASTNADTFSGALDAGTTVTAPVTDTSVDTHVGVHVQTP
jgi:RNA polymerase sigma-70 factor (ECF subfamily)